MQYAQSDVSIFTRFGSFELLPSFPFGQNNDVKGICRKGVVVQVETFYKGEDLCSVTAVAEYLHTRGIVYDFLRRTFFEEPDRRYLNICQSCGFFEDIPFSASIDSVRTGAELVAGYFAKCDPLHDDEEYALLRWDFTRAFVGPCAPVAPPWASYYLEPDRLLFQDTTLAVRKVYARYGIMAGDRLNSEADDHVGIELDFIFLLNQRSIEMLEKANWTSLPIEVFSLLEEQRNFIRSHLLTFIPSFVELLFKEAQTDFYKGAALILAGFLEGDIAMLNAIMEQREEK